jgi:hypothetical protein
MRVSYNIPKMDGPEQCNSGVSKTVNAKCVSITELRLGGMC